MRTFGYNWQMTKYQFFSKRLKLTPVKSPWMTFWVWTRKGGLCITTRAPRLTYDIVNHLRHLWADIDISFLLTVPQPKTDNFESPSNGKACILTRQVGWQVSVLCPRGDNGHEWTKTSRVTMHGHDVSMFDSCARIDFALYALRIARFRQLINPLELH